MCAHSGLTDQAWLARHVVKGEIAGPRASNVMKIIKPKYPVACSRSVGAAGERDLLWSNYAFVCGGSAGELCLSCTAPIVIESSVMNKTCDPVSIRV